MKKLLFIFTIALGFTTASKAQSADISAENANAINNYDGVRGNFEYALNDRERVNVNYALNPKNPTTVAHFMLHTPEAMPLWATVTDAAGKVVLTWKPEQKVYLYNADWNVSKLTSGTYTVNVYMDAEKKSIYQFNFSK